MYILVRIIALLFNWAPSVWRVAALVHWSLLSLVENRKAEGSCISDSKMEIFPWVSNIYRWRIYLWNVSYALRETAHLKHIKQREASLSEAHAAFLSEHLTDRAA